MSTTSPIAPTARSQPTPARPSGRTTSPWRPYLGSIQADDSKQERVRIDELDVLMMRSDPADDQQRTTVGSPLGSPVRAAGCGQGNPRRQRPGQPRQRPQQDLLPALPRSGTATHPDLPRPRRDHRVHARVGPVRRAQAIAGIGWRQRLPRLERRVTEPQPDDRSDRPRRLRRRPGVPRRRRTRRHPAVRDERRTAAARRQLRRVPAREQGLRHPIEHARRRRTGTGQGHRHHARVGRGPCARS